ncbi:hypothetical protein [Micromonospora endolithica]|uniref:hypothetical protein n=1 Tax=Micromonospora endolithica TaxID=230091 RepID=UPI0011AC4593|nr:hypothetical protein JD76_03842 [Micromonospora endolithica]
MRFVRTVAGMVLLVIGIPALLVGTVLWQLTRHADPGGAFTARTETVHTAGHAVVVTDVDALLRTEAPFARAGSSRLRLTARTPDGPAFVGLAPAEEVRRWLDPVPHAEVRRVALSRGPLPVRVAPAGTAAGPVAPVPPVGQPFWVRDGTGTLEWSPADLADRRLSLVVMRPNGRADLRLDLRAEWRPGWTGPATAGLLTGGVLLVVLGVLLLLRPVRPREVVFVVEPDQVPVLAGRLGVTSLSGLGAQPTRDDDRPRVTARQLVSVGAAERSRPALDPVPDERPATLADLGTHPPLTWPPSAPAPTAPPTTATSPGVAPPAAVPPVVGPPAPSAAADTPPVVGPSVAAPAAVTPSDATPSAPSPAAVMPAAVMPPGGARLRPAAPVAEPDVPS